MQEATAGKALVRWATVWLLLLLFPSSLLVGCGADRERGEGFAIHLLTNDAQPAGPAAPGTIHIAEEPLIAAADIVAYSRQTHEIELTAAAYIRVCNLEVPLTGRPFAVCVDGDPVYAGAFVTPLWSGTFDGVVIWKPLTGDTSTCLPTLRLELGYPSPECFSGEDPRSEPRILEALDEAGKSRP